MTPQPLENQGGLRRTEKLVDIATTGAGCAAERLIDVTNHWRGLRRPERPVDAITTNAGCAERLSDVTTIGTGCAAQKDQLTPQPLARAAPRRKTG